MKYSYISSLHFKCVQILSLMETNQIRIDESVKRVNYYDKVRWDHPLRLNFRKEEIVQRLDELNRIQERLLKYYKNTMSKIKNYTINS